MSETKPGTPNRIIRGSQYNPEQSLNHRDAVVREERAKTSEKEGIPRVVTDYFPRRPLPAGDPSSPSGVYVAEEELDEDLRKKVNAAGQLLEVTLTFSGTLPPGMVFNIQTGVYPGPGSPATVEGDKPPTGGPIRSGVILLPPTGKEFKEDGRISVCLNGQELERSDGAANGDAEWVSSTQLRLPFKTIHTGNQVMVRAPEAPPSSPAI